MHGQPDMSLNDRYNPAAFSDEEDEDTVATPMDIDSVVSNLKFCFRPHQCVITGRRLWLEKAYQIKTRYTGYDQKNQFHEITYTHWASKHEYIIAKLKQ